jgi:hypothetical protein
MIESEKYLELEKLVSLAEDVSNNLTFLDRSKNNFLLIFSSFFVTLFVVLFLAVYYLMKYLLSDTTYLILLPVLVFLFCMYGMIFLIRYKKMVFDIENESEILNNLLDMIHSYKEAIYLELTYTNRALIDMKLSRISFALLEKYKRQRKREQPLFRMAIYDDEFGHYDLTSPMSSDRKLTNDVYKMQEVGMKIRCQSVSLNTDKSDFQRSMNKNGYTLKVDLYQTLQLRYKDEEGWPL